MDLIGTDELPNWQIGIVRTEKTLGAWNGFTAPSFALVMPRTTKQQNIRYFNMVFASKIISEAQSQRGCKDNLLISLLSVYIFLLKMTAINKTDIWKLSRHSFQEQCSTTFKYNKC
jgi:hypothetical protein